MTLNEPELHVTPQEFAEMQEWSLGPPELFVDKTLAKWPHLRAYMFKDITVHVVVQWGGIERYVIVLNENPMTKFFREHTPTIADEEARKILREIAGL
jgi:hypothetical protein